MPRPGHLLLLVLLPATAALAQEAPARPAAPADTLYAEATDERQVASLVDTSQTCTELLRWGEHHALLRTYYPSGALRSYVPYADFDRGLRHGHASDWYESGQLRTLLPYVQGWPQGQMLCYYEDGQLRRQSQYEAGRELPGLCYDEAGQPVPYFPYEQPPLYPGGDAHFTLELSKRVRRALPSFRTVAGMVPSSLLVSFLVDEAGQLKQARLEAASLAPGYDQAVLQALREPGRPWLPGLRDGQPSAYHYRLRLPVGPGAGPGYLWHL